MLNNLIIFIIKDGYSILLAIITGSSIMYCMYSKIKYECLLKASKMVAEAEGRENLTGEEKFALVTLWINEELPIIFKNNIVRAIISALIQYAYNNSYDYMKNYIKRKTGKDIDEVVNVIKEEIEKQNTNKEDNSINS